MQKPPDVGKVLQFRRPSPVDEFAQFALDLVDNFPLPATFYVLLRNEIEIVYIEQDDGMLEVILSALRARSPHDRFEIHPMVFSADEILSRLSKK